MRVDDFDYGLPEELIAYYPNPRRDASKLMVLDMCNEAVSHERFFELPAFLHSGDVVVLNDIKVIPARLTGFGPGRGRVEVLLTQRLGPTLWKAMMRKPKDGMRLVFPRGMEGEIKRMDEGHWVVEFASEADCYIEEWGAMPLPPYIKREPVEADRTSYQTVYAEKKSAIAAPTAGLHFTAETLRSIEEKGVELRYVTLHIGVGTFQPVKTRLITDHVMHPEFREVPIDTAESVNAAKEAGRRIIAVGTTVVRTLESCVGAEGEIRPCEGYTDLFIYPGFKFSVVDALLTNFHLPRSTLLMLVCAFAGREFVLGAYSEAIEKKYRFLSYGDAMLIL